MNPKASEVAAELRRIADALDKEPETEVKRPLFFFYCDTKDQFLATARLLPRPLAKKLDGDDGDTYQKLCLESDIVKGPIWVRTTINRSLMCRLVKEAQPAVYDCEPILSQAEEESLI